MLGRMKVVLELIYFLLLNRIDNKPAIEIGLLDSTHCILK